MWSNCCICCINLQHTPVESESFVLQLWNSRQFIFLTMNKYKNPQLLWGFVLFLSDWHFSNSLLFCALLGSLVKTFSSSKMGLKSIFILDQLSSMGTFQIKNVHSKYSHTIWPKQAHRIPKKGVTVAFKDTPHYGAHSSRFNFLIFFI